MIGDPTGKNVTRKPLSREDVLANAQTYADQAFKVLTAIAPRCAIHLSGSQMDKVISRLAARQWSRAMLERDGLCQALRRQQPIADHEFLYPLVQGYDSVALKAGRRARRDRPEVQSAGWGAHAAEDAGQPQIVADHAAARRASTACRRCPSSATCRHQRAPMIDIVNKTMKIGDEPMRRWYELLSSIARRPRSRARSRMSPVNAPADARS